MTFAPAMAATRTVRKTHAATVRRVYRTWTPEDLHILERHSLRKRRMLMRMVADDYTQVVLSTSQLVITGRMRKPPRKARVIPLRAPLAPGQLWRKLYALGRFIKIESPCSDSTYYAVSSCNEAGTLTWCTRITRATHISKNYEYVRDLP